MSLFRVLDIAGTALGAESVRLNLVASNLANAESVAGSEAGAYRARQPIFATLLEEAGMTGGDVPAGIQVTGIIESTAPARREYQPDHPLADAAGYIYLPNVNPVAEMTDMISASRAFQTNTEVINTAKQMILRLLALGQ